MPSRDDYRGYVVPGPMYVGRSPKTERLYDLERRRDDLVQQCAREWAKLTGEGEGSEHWQRAVPQALRDALAGFSPACGIAAAIGYLRSEILRDPLKAEDVRDLLAEVLDLDRDLIGGGPAKSLGGEQGGEG